MARVGGRPAAAQTTSRWSRAVRRGWNPESSSTAPTVAIGRSMAA